MNIDIVTFPETKVAVIEHRGSPALEYDTARKLIAWKLEHRLLDQTKYRSYGLHYTDPFNVSPDLHRVDFCLSVEEDVAENFFGIKTMTIPSMRCALARDIGSRSNNQAAAYLYRTWLPRSNEALGNYPTIFHYVNVGPSVADAEMITDVYLPLS